MLEILVLWTLTKRIGNVVEAKGHKSGGYKLLTVVLWFGGEIVGAIIGAFATGGNESGQCAAYLFALLGAIVGAGVAYGIANSLSPAYTSTTPIRSGPASVEELLADLGNVEGFEIVRALAARNLGELRSSELRVVNALITALESDPALAVRKEAAKAILQQHPELLDKVDALSAQYLSDSN